MDLSMKSEVENDKYSMSLSITSSPAAASLKSEEDEDQDGASSSVKNVMPIKMPSISSEAVGLNQFINGTSFPGVSTSSRVNSVENNLNLLAQAVLCNSQHQSVMTDGGNRNNSSGQFQPSQTPIRPSWNSAFSFLPGYSHHPSYFFPGNSGYNGAAGSDALLSGSSSKSSSTFTATASSAATSSSSVSVGLPPATQASTARASVSQESDHSNSELFGNRRRQVRHHLTTSSQSTIIINLDPQPATQSHHILHWTVVPSGGTLQEDSLPRRSLARNPGKVGGQKSLEFILCN